jgi:hypothetical protein
MPYTTIDNPELYFQCKTYSGDGTAIGSGGQAITLDGSENMQPDMIWVKSRTDSQNHNLCDSARGATEIIYVNSTYFDETKAEAIVLEGWNNIRNNYKWFNNNYSISLFF